MRRLIATIVGLLLVVPVTAQERPVPYWASIAAGEAMMRTGPDRGYPAIWVYHRRDLPLRVVQVNGAWRRVQEQDGSNGWMLATLLSARRTGVVVGGNRAIHERPDQSSRLLWRVAPGVVGRISRCDGTWCRIQVGDKIGYIEQFSLWGTDIGERVP